MYLLLQAIVIKHLQFKYKKHKQSNISWHRTFGHLNEITKQIIVFGSSFSQNVFGEKQQRKKDSFSAFNMFCLLNCWIWNVEYHCSSPLC